MLNLCGGLMNLNLSNIVPRDNICDYMVYGETEQQMYLLKNPLPPIGPYDPEVGPVTYVNNTPNQKYYDLYALVKSMDVQVVTYDDLYRICEVLLRKEEEKEGSIFK